MKGCLILPSGLGQLTVPNWDFAPHLQEVESQFLALTAGHFRRLMVSIPIRHGKSQYANLFIAWLLICYPRTRILRVMASSTTCEMEALGVLECVQKYGPILNGVTLDRRKASVSHFKTMAGGELRSVGASGDVESWTFDWIIIDDIITDPYEIRNPNRRSQIYQDLCTKFFSRVNPLGSTRFVFIGSRRHPDDPQGRLLEADRTREEKDRWVYHVSPAILNEDTDHEEALWPTSKEFDLEGLRRVRAEKTTNGVLWEWRCNFQNDAMGSPDQLSFDQKWMGEDMFYSFPSEALPPAKFRILCTDPSMGAGTEGSDFFASLYLHIEPNGTIWLDDSFIAVCKPDLMVPMMGNLLSRHQDVDICPFEDNAGGLYAANLIKRECDARGLRFPAVFKTYGSANEDEKISRIIFHLWEILSNGRLKIRDTPMNRQFYRQLVQFPTAKLDGPDALATGVIVLKEVLRR